MQTITELNAQLESSCSGAQIGVLTVEYTGNDSTRITPHRLSTHGASVPPPEQRRSDPACDGVGAVCRNGVYYLTYGDGFRNTTLAKQSSAIAQTMEDQFAAKDYDGAVTTCAGTWQTPSRISTASAFPAAPVTAAPCSPAIRVAEQRRQRPDRHPDPCGRRDFAHRHYPVDGLCFCQSLRLAVVLRRAAASSQTSRPAAPAGRLLRRLPWPPASARRRLWRHGRRLLGGGAGRGGFGGGGFGGMGGGSSHGGGGGRGR